MAAVPNTPLAAMFSNGGVQAMQQMRFESARNFFHAAWDASRFSDSIPLLESLDRDETVLPRGARMTRNEASLQVVANPITIFHTTSTTTMDDLESRTLQKSVILFNLGLVYQVIRPACDQVAQFYHQSAYALTSMEDSCNTFVLAIAGMNNFAVWCQVTGDMPGARSCIQNMATLFAEEDEFCLEDDSLLLRRVVSNIACHLDMKEVAASPAA